MRTSASLKCESLQTQNNPRNQIKRLPQVLDNGIASNNAEAKFALETGQITTGKLIVETADTLNETVVAARQGAICNI